MNRYIALKRIIELGSFTKAAQDLGYTQPALSQMITSLEHEIGMRLLFRSNKGISLTPEGNRLFPSIVNFATQYQEVQEVIGELHGLDTGTVHIGTVTSISVHWLPDLISEFKETYPHIRFILHQGDWKSIVDWVNSRYIDFGFANPKAATNNETVFLKDDPLFAVLPKDSPLADKDFVTLEQLEKEPFILLEEGSYNEALIEFKKENLSPNIAITAHDDYAIMKMVEKGLGISILPELVLTDTHFDIVTKPIYPEIHRSLGIVMPTEGSIPIASQRFIDFIIKRKDALK